MRQRPSKAACRPLRIGARPTLVGSLCLLGALASADPARAQETEGDSARAALAAEAQNKLVRIHHTSGRLFTGPYGGLAGDSLHLQPWPEDEAGARAFDLSELTRVDARGRATVPGAWIGGVAGAVAGGLVGALAHSLCEGDCGTGTKAVVGLGLLGGGAGAAFGALVGAAFPRWHRIWP